MTVNISNHLTPPKRSFEAGVNIRAGDWKIAGDAISTLFGIHHPVNMMQDGGYVEGDGFLGEDIRERRYLVKSPRRMGFTSAATIICNIGAKDGNFAWGINVYVDGVFVDNFSPTAYLVGFQSVLDLTIPDDSDYFELKLEVDDWESGAGWLEGIYLIYPLDPTDTSFDSALYARFNPDGANFYLPDDSEFANNHPLAVHLGQNMIHCLLSLYAMSSRNILADSREYSGPQVLTLIEPTDVVGVTTLVLWFWAAADGKSCIISAWQDGSVLDYVVVLNLGANNFDWYELRLTPAIGGGPVEVTLEDAALEVNSVCGWWEDVTPP